MRIDELFSVPRLHPGQIERIEVGDDGEISEITFARARPSWASYTTGMTLKVLDGEDVTRNPHYVHILDALNRVWAGSTIPESAADEIFGCLAELVAQDRAQQAEAAKVADAEPGDDPDDEIDNGTPIVDPQDLVPDQLAGDVADALSAVREVPNTPDHKES